MTKPTEKELEILQTLWNQGASTVRTVNELVGKDKEVGYTTTLKLMQIMHEKGLLDRVKDGKTHIYSAAYTQEKTQKQLIDRLLDTAFGGSAMNLVMQALGNQKSSERELEELRSFINELEKKQS